MSAASAISRVVVRSNPLRPKSRRAARTMRSCLLRLLRSRRERSPIACLSVAVLSVLIYEYRQLLCEARFLVNVFFLLFSLPAAWPAARIDRGHESGLRTRTVDREGTGCAIAH